jgi:hypothetical protein
MREQHASGWTGHLPGLAEIDLRIRPRPHVADPRQGIGAAFREILPEPQVCPRPDPQVPAVGNALVGEPHAREHRERARPSVWLTWCQAVHMGSAGEVREWREGDGDLGEVRIRDIQAGTQQLSGEFPDTSLVVEVEQRMPPRPETRPDEMRRATRRSGLPIQQSGNSSAACNNLLIGQEPRDDQVTLSAEVSSHLVSNRRHGDQCTRHGARAQSNFREFLTHPRDPRCRLCGNSVNRTPGGSASLT